MFISLTLDTSAPAAFVAKKGSKACSIASALMPVRR
jgi:hypothetical protein